MSHEDSKRDGIIISDLQFFTLLAMAIIVLCWIYRLSNDSYVAFLACLGKQPLVGNGLRMQGKCVCVFLGEVCLPAAHGPYILYV